MFQYKCSKCCEFKSNKFQNILSHVFRKKECIKNINSLKVSDDDHIILSLIPYNKDNIHIINKNHIRKYSNICVNKEILLTKLKNNNKICEYCNKSFETIQKLRNHIIIDCFQNEINNENITTPFYDEVFRLDNIDNEIKCGF